jgi:hypothetical protein
MNIKATTLLLFSFLRVSRISERTIFMAALLESTLRQNFLDSMEMEGVVILARAVFIEEILSVEDVLARILAR